MALGDLSSCGGPENAIAPYKHRSDDTQAQKPDLWLNPRLLSCQMRWACFLLARWTSCSGIRRSVELRRSGKRDCAVRTSQRRHTGPETRSMAQSSSFELSNAIFVGSVDELLWYLAICLVAAVRKTRLRRINIAATAHKPRNPIYGSIPVF